MMTPLKTLTSLVVLLCIGGGSCSTDGYSAKKFRVCENLRDLVETCDMETGNDTVTSKLACGTRHTPECSCTHFGFGPYDGPDKWGDFCPACKEEYQSPIDIGCDIITYPMEERGNQLGDSMKSAFTFLLRNEGYTVTMKLPQFTIWGADLLDEYTFEKIQIFWGSNDSVGSHHTIRGKSYAMEVQFTFINTEYFRDYEDAAGNGEVGVIMLSYLLKLAENDNPSIQTIVDLLPKVMEPGQEANSEHTISLEYLINTQNFQEFYSYVGSLTTPPCNKGFRWHVSEATYGVSSKQVAEFRKLHSPVGPMLTNIRPVQPRHGRDITHSNKGSEINCAPHPSQCASQHRHVKSSTHHGVSRHN